jgi:hypothetical protein
MKDKKRSAAKLNMKNPLHGAIEKREKKRAKTNKINRIATGIMTGGASEVARKLVKADALTIDTRKIMPGLKKMFNKIKNVPSQALTTGFNKKPGAFKLRSGNKPSIAKLAGLKRDPKDPFYVTPKGPEVKDNMPKMSPKELQKIIEKEKRKTPKGFIKIPEELKNLPSKNKPKGVHGYTITKDIKKRK